MFHSLLLLPTFGQEKKYNSATSWFLRFEILNKAHLQSFFILIIQVKNWGEKRAQTPRENAVFPSINCLDCHRDNKTNSVSLMLINKRAPAAK